MCRNKYNPFNIIINIVLLFTLSFCITFLNCSSDLSERAMESKKERVRTLGKQLKIVEKRNANDSEEYYIGSRLAASLLANFTPHPDTNLQKYINAVGTTISLISDRPNPYNGYRFIVLKTELQNAFAAPGGYIFITSGLLKLISNEDELAGVLSHEILHMVYKHPINTLRIYSKQRLEKEIKEELGESNETDQEELTILRKGYEAKQEEEADVGAVFLMIKSGYDPVQLSAVLGRLGRFKSTKLTVHGDPVHRAKNLLEICDKQKYLPQINDVRTNRFKEYVPFF